jgi:hypothetical protein
MFVAQLQDEIKNNAHLFADPDNVIDIVLHLDPHQPEFIHVQPAKHPTIAVDHDNSVLGGIEGIKGDVYSMETKDELRQSILGDSHRIVTYFEEVDKVLDQHNKNGQNNTSNKYEGFKEAFKDQITKEQQPTK